MGRKYGFLIILALLMAGCATPPSGTDAVGGGPTPSGTAGPDQTSGDHPPGPNGTPPPGLAKLIDTTFQLDGCRGMIGTGDVPISSVEDLLPSAFNPLGFTGDTAGVTFYGLACEQAYVGEDEYADVSFFQTQVLVAPVDESWDMEGLDWYVLDLLVEGFDLPFGYDHDALFTFENATEGVTRWSVRNASGPGEYGFEYPGSGSPNTGYESRENHWFGDGPEFWHVPGTASFEYDAVVTVAGVMRSDGDTRTTAAFGVVSPPLLESAFTDFSMNWRLDSHNKYS